MMGIWAWGQWPSWTSAQEPPSAPELQAATWTPWKVVKETYCCSSPLLVDTHSIVHGSHL